MPPAARIRAFLWIPLLLALAGCQPRGFTCKSGICIRLAIEQPVQALKPVLVTVTVKTEKSIPDLAVILDSGGAGILETPQTSAPGATVIGQEKTLLTWHLDTKNGIDYTFTAYVVLRQANEHGVTNRQIRALASHPTMGVAIDAVRIRLNADGQQVERQTSGHEILVPKSVLTVTPGPSPTLRPTRAPRLVPTATPTTTPAPLRPAYPAPTDAGRLAPAQRAATPAYPLPE